MQRKERIYSQNQQVMSESKDSRNQWDSRRARLAIRKIDGSATDSLQALNEEDGGKSSAPDLVRDIPFVAFDADGRKFFGEVGIAEIPPFQLGFQQALDLRLPILVFGGDVCSPEAMLES